MKPSCLSDARWSAGSRLVTAFLLICAAACSTACSTKKSNGSLQRFVQSGNITLVEITGREGRSWKVLSASGSSIRGYAVLDSNGRVALIASVSADNTGARHAAVRVDAHEKEAVLAVLDKGFLTDVANQTESYKEWAVKEAVFGGAVHDTVTIDAKSGSLGAGTVSVQGGGIVTKLQVNCSCETNVQCWGSGDPGKADCWNRICTWFNCVFGGGGGNCGELLTTAQTGCAAVGKL